MLVRTRHIAASILFACLILCAAFSILQPAGQLAVLRSTPQAMAPVTHTVLFQFKADADPDHVKAACARFLALRSTCLHPLTGETCILSLKGGKDNSPEGLQGGITHGFVAEFASVEDRDYYVGEDRTHRGFVKSLDGLVDKAIVVDFEDGVF